MTLFLGLGLWGCGEEKKPAQEGTDVPPCNEDPTVCVDGALCEQVGATGYQCLPPVRVRGRVIEAEGGAGIPEATVVAVDANGAARSKVARSGPDGSYELPLSMKRADDGRPLTDKITLRVAADDHLAFPTAPRVALPIDLQEAEPEPLADAGAEAIAADAGARADQIWVVENSATDVALIALPAAEAVGVTVSGHIVGDSPGGVLVLAVAGDASKSSAITDSDGAFVLFNVPEGASTLQGYRAGLVVAPANVSVPATGLADVMLTASAGPLTKITGSVSIVNAAGGLTTSVILAVASTFDPTAARGEAPAGLRATNVSGAFEIPNVPPGRYAVLAAFENDQLVRDPDQSIAGTDIVYIDVPTTGGNLSAGTSFKVTEALAVQAPGAQDTERVKAGPITLRWADDSSEDGYELTVYDALGNLVHENKDVPRVNGNPSVTYTLDASAFKVGMIYQFKAKSWRSTKASRTYISSTEDLRGVFEIAP